MFVLYGKKYFDTNLYVHIISSKTKYRMHNSTSMQSMFVNHESSDATKLTAIINLVNLRAGVKSAISQRITLTLREKQKSC